MNAREVIKVSEINKFLSEKTGINSCNNSKTYYCEECPRLSDNYKGALIDPSTGNCLFVTPADFFTPVSMVKLMEWLCGKTGWFIITALNDKWRCDIQCCYDKEIALVADTPQEAVARATYAALGGENKGD